MIISLGWHVARRGMNYGTYGMASGANILTMAGQKMEREARVALTGMTQVQRMDWIRQTLADNPRCTERQIAKALGVSPAAAHYLVHEIRTGQKRVSAVKRDLCDECWQEFPITELVEGLCPQHRTV